MLDFVRQLRSRPSDAESVFWYLLRDRRLSGLKFRRQYPVPPYVLDFYCQELKLAVELDGGQHNLAGEAARDDRRTKYLEARGIRVLRYWDHEVLNETEAVLESLMLAADDQRSLTPSPSPEGRGEAAP